MYNYNLAVIVRMVVCHGGILLCHGTNMEIVNGNTESMGPLPFPKYHFCGIFQAQKYAACLTNTCKNCSNNCLLSIKFMI